MQPIRHQHGAIAAETNHHIVEDAKAGAPFVATKTLAGPARRPLRLIEVLLVLVAVGLVALVIWGPRTVAAPCDPEGAFVDRCAKAAP